MGPHYATEISGFAAGPVRRFAWVAGLLAALWGAGCQTVHEVTVDAISNPKKSIGQSYRLEVLDPSGGVDSDLQSAAIATIKDTLAARGLYEAPPGVKPDSVITYTYGVGHGHINIVTQANTDMLLGPMAAAPTTSSKAVVVYDKFIELSAREVPDTTGPARPGTLPARGEEKWNIKATIVDAKKTLDAYLPALATACIDYIGANSGKELHFKIESKEALEVLHKRSHPATPTATIPATPPAPAK
ncbi:MAG TPA: hypothetical protein VG734_04535 [Lacunisphaera sp.]|nr:hypothetical protein [Lacunisphaera sp.]